MYLVRRSKGFSAVLRSNQAAKLSSANGGLGMHDKAKDFITPRSVDYSAWCDCISSYFNFFLRSLFRYSDILMYSDMVDQSPVRGCMVIKPWGMGVWDLIRTDADRRIRETGTQNAYFPLLIPKSFLAKEAEHVDGFAKECAVVTHHRLCVSKDGTELIPDPDAVLEVPIIQYFYKS